MYVARDIPGTRKAIVELFRYAYDDQDRKKRQRLALLAANGDEVIRGGAKDLTLPDGYYSRVAFLIWLQERLDLGVGVDQLSLTAHDVEGLIVLAQEKAKFDREHPGCMRCGTRNTLGMFQCRKCGQSLKAGGKGRFE